MENASRIKDLISKNIIEAPPINLNEGGVFRQYVSKDLDSLRNIKNEKQKEILAMQEKYCRIRIYSARGAESTEVSAKMWHGVP